MKLSFLSVGLVSLSMLVACDDSSSGSNTMQAEILDAISSSEIVVIPESSSSLEIVSSESVADTDLVESSSAEAPVADTVWNRANLTWYTSWPEPGSEECEDYNGCTWAGWFAGLEEQQTEEWVSEHNIIAVHEKDWDTYKLKTFRLRKSGHTIDAVVYDMCSDSDCDGCCTQNAGKVGFLIDIESYTRKRFNNYGSGVVEWTCLDCGVSSVENAD